LQFKPDVAEMSTLPPTSPVCYELRRYQLKLGYPTVPDFLKSYGEGLQDKLRADDSGASTLVTLLYNEVGPLNTVLELWRHQVPLSCDLSAVNCLPFLSPVALPPCPVQTHAPRMV